MPIATSSGQGSGPEILERLTRLNTWRRGGVRAPHKPLLLLLALGRLSRGLRHLPFAECEADLAALLTEFGPPSKSLHPEYPFWRLQGDGLWVVSSDRPINCNASKDPPRRELRAANSFGQFSPEVFAALDGSPGAVTRAAQALLDDNFPMTLHDDIRAAVGLVESDSAGETIRRSRRDPNFRNAVLQAYEFRCAVCSLDLRLGNLTIGLEAAHIKWHMAHGPDSIQNGLSLCALHHKLFDYGALTVADGYRVLVSDHVHGGERFDEVLMRHHAQPLRSPVRVEDQPAQPFVNWHRAQVFKGQARPCL